MQIPVFLWFAYGAGAIVTSIGVIFLARNDPQSVMSEVGKTLVGTGFMIVVVSLAVWFGLGEIAQHSGDRLARTISGTINEQLSFVAPSEIIAEVNRQVFRQSIFYEDYEVYCGGYKAVEDDRLQGLCESVFTIHNRSSVPYDFRPLVLLSEIPRGVKVEDMIGLVEVRTSASDATPIQTLGKSDFAICIPSDDTGYGGLEPTEQPTCSGDPSRHYFFAHLVALQSIEVRPLATLQISQIQPSFVNQSSDHVMRLVRFPTVGRTRLRFTLPPGHGPVSGVFLHPICGEVNKACQMEFSGQGKNEVSLTIYEPLLPYQGLGVSW